MEALQAPFTTGSDRSPYQAIDSDGGEIRLVELLPGGYDDSISLSLHIHDLSCQFEYEALSYAWGTAISPRKALVDKIDLRITKSLDQGLRHLRFNDRPRMLWIDALCINQRDIQERSLQVKHMAMIYRSAKHVLIWLGEWPNSEGCSHLDDCQALWLSTLREEERGNPALTPLHVREHFVDIMALPWFSRLWVIQELALAEKDPIVLVGSLSTSWSSFCETVEDILLYRSSEMADDRQLLDQFQNDYTRVSALDRIRSRSDSHQGLYCCLITSQYAMSADPRDKVYGLLGLCDFQITEAIAADYSKPLQHVLAEATVVSILEESALPYFGEDTKPPGAFDRTYWTKSSWLIDFTSMSGKSEIEDVCNSELSLEEREERQGSIKLSVDCQTMYTHGRFVGTVCETLDSLWGLMDEGNKTPDAALYDFYHGALKPRGVTPLTLLLTIRKRNSKFYDDSHYHFASLLRGSRDMFRLPHDAIQEHDLFVTEEGHFGFSWHLDCKRIHVGAVLVCLFGTQVPFILAPLPEIESYEMVNVAYVLDYGDLILKREDKQSKRKAWTNFAAEGGKEYAIV
ncbi:heterokaryon incompatibility protein-domain-containing protein [Alternaria rosae]|uniref:heterokaryon incompatibility protein-domain-containing protein n=1 Tax=Alternaria rosae TaxID=1187941 RepID=UPI001E8D176D|nr:heterokaryon incompatibility protein-domain-containing protein [Alternaria rosae]KAH6864728.1 heterokaryon incompatibility protein-domain-containing protein [Alternaria rosae]